MPKRSTPYVPNTFTMKNVCILQQLFSWGRGAPSYFLYSKRIGIEVDNGFPESLRDGRVTIDPLTYSDFSYLAKSKNAVERQKARSHIGISPRPVSVSENHKGQQRKKSLSTRHP